MSIDAGGLAQMTYQSPFNNTIGVSGPGFASRGKGSHIKRLSVAPPPKISTIDETQQVNASSTPRTSRSHLLAGLRTAPKSAVFPPSSGYGLENSKYAQTQYGSREPQTATAAFFAHNMTSPAYAHPDQVLSPPNIDLYNQTNDNIDQNLYDELVATNAHLQQQQRMLQQQLMNLQTAAAQQQLQNMTINSAPMNYSQLQSPASAPPYGQFQQFQQTVQQIQAVPGMNGVYVMYNPATGQPTYFTNNNVQQQTPVSATPNPVASPPAELTRQWSGNTASPAPRAVSPPKSTPSPPHDVEPLPPPSANAFRRGHRKNVSSTTAIKTTGEWNKAPAFRSAGLPPTPMTGTFGPGQGRAGEHPVRQPRNPPHLQELQEKPTSKHEGSKNFATRQRRRAVQDLVKAGRERRIDGRHSSSGSGTPASEAEFNFSVSSSENDELLARSTTLSSKPSLGSLRAAANGAIGSERKEKSRERNSVDSTGAISTKSLSSDEGNSIGGNMVEVEPTRRSTPRFVLSNAEKRKSAMM